MNNIKDISILQNRMIHHNVIFTGMCHVERLQTEIRILEGEIAKLMTEIDKKKNKVDEHKESIARIQNKIR